MKWPANHLIVCIARQALICGAFTLSLHAQTSPLLITSLHVSNDTVTITWEGGDIARPYQLQKAQSISGSWQNVDGLRFTTILASSLAEQSAFFRVQQGNLPRFASDLDPPTVPAGLTAYSSNCSQVVLFWNPSVDDPGGSGLIGYFIYRNGAFLAQAPAWATSFLDAGLLSPSTTYNYALLAVDAAGNFSSLTPTVTLATPACNNPTAPTTPTGLTATPLNATQIRLSWNASTDSSGSGVAGYNLFRNGRFLSHVAAPVTTALDVGLIPGTTNAYSVSAINNSGNQSAQIVPLNAATPADALAPSVPVGLIALAVSCNQINLSWIPSADLGFHASGLRGYNVYRNGAFLTQVMAPTTSDAGLAASTLYSYSVSAIDNVGNESAASSLVSATTPACPCSFSLGQASASYSSGGGAGSVTVTASAGCSWGASTIFAWIHTTSTGSGNGTVNYTVDSNGSLGSRQGTISIGGQTFAISQAGGAPSLGEAVDNNSLPWMTGGDAVWVGQTASSFNGGDAAASGPIGNGQTSWLQTTVAGPATLSFYWKVSSEATYDFLRFYLDGVEQLTAAGISGEVDWQQRSVTVGSGNHVARWEYSKDAICCAGGSDTAWIDQVQVTGAGCTYSISPTNSLFASAGGAASLTVTAGAGCSWSASTINSWIHTTSGGSGSGSVNFSVDVNGSTNSRSGTIIVGDQTFTISQTGAANSDFPPVANAGPDFSVAIGAIANFSAAGSSDPDGTIVSYQWDFGDGNSGSGFSVSHVYSILGLYTVRLTVTDYLGATGTDTALATVQAPPDVTPPTVSLTLSGSANVSGTFSLNAVAIDNTSVAKVEFYRDGTLFTTITVSPYATSYDSRTLANGSHSFLAKAYDVAGNNNSSSLTVLVDNTAPSAALTSPANSITVSNNITLAATATDNSGGSGVARLEFYVDSQGSPLGTATTAPYNSPLDTTAIANGVHTFYCKAYDAAGNSAASPTASVTILNVSGAPGQFLWSASLVATQTFAEVRPQAVTTDRNGNVIVAGYFKGTVGFGGGPAISAGDKDAFVAKFSANGQFIWAKQFGTPYEDSATAVTTDSNGNILIGGFSSGNPNFGGGSLTNHGQLGYSDGFLAKLSPGGIHIWSKGFGGFNSDSVNAVAVDRNDDVLIAGSIFFGPPVDFECGTLSSAGDKDIFVAKCSSASGACLWARRAGGPGRDEARALAVDTNNDVLIAGNFALTNDFGGGSLVSAGGYDIFVAKLAGGNGSVRWSRSFGDDQDQFVYTLAVDTNGSLVVAGDFYGVIDFNGGSVTNSSSNLNMFLAKLSSDGTYVWSRAFQDGASSDFARSVAVTKNGDVLLTGQISGLVDFGNGYPSVSDNDIFAAKFSSNGDYGWANRFEGNGDDSGQGIAADSSGNLLLTGWFSHAVNFGSTQITNSGAIGGFLVKFAP